MWLTVATLYFATVITADPFRLASLAMMLELSTFVFEIPTGVLADSFSRKWSLVIGYLIWGGGFLLQALVPVYEIVLLSQAIWGLGFTFVSGAAEAWLVDEVGQEQALPLFLRGSQLGQLATLFGIGVATALGTVNVAIPILVSGIGALVLAILLAAIMPERGFKPVKHPGAAPFAPVLALRSALREMRGRAVLRGVIIIGIIIGSSVGGFDSLYTPHLLRNFSIPLLEPVVWFGILYGGVTLLSIPALELVKQLMRRRPQLSTARVLSWFAVGTVLGNLVFVWSSGFYLAVLAYCFSQVLRTATKPLFMAWVNRHTPSEVRATVISTYWQSNAMGQIVGAPTLGAIGSLVSLRVALTAASVALLPVIPIYRRYRKDPGAEAT